MSAGLGRAIASVQSETQKVAADLTAVTAEQARLFETVRENNEQLTDKVAVIEQAQQQRQDTIGGMQDNIMAVASSITALGEDVLRLQEILQNNIRELVSIADITGQKQIEFQDSIRKDLLTLDESLASIRQNQGNLESRIEQMRNNGPDLSDVPAALDQLRDQLEELSRSRMVDEADSTEYDSSAETDNIE
jgi:DNA repair exonuclease SbcCD ATPase subunit